MNSPEQSDRKSISGESVATVFTEDLDFGGIANNVPLEKKITVTSLEPYSVFPQSQKLLIVVIAALTGIVSPLSANIYFPALNAIEEDLNTTTELVNLTITVYMIFQGLSPSFWGSLADIWGRRPVYLGTLIVYMGACVGLAMTPAYWVLLVLRMLQAFGSSSVIAIGAGVIGDIATPSERGSYFGFFSIGQNLGPVLGPVLGGIISEALSWRWIFWILLMIGGAFFIAIFFFLPETLRSLVGNGSGHANPTPSQWWERRQQAKKHQSRDIEAPVTSDTASETSTIANAEDKRTTTKSRFLQVPDVTQPFTYLLQKDVIIALVYNAIHYATYYCYMTSTPTQFELIYGMSEIQVGLCFLPSGIGCIIGSFIGGRLLDHDFKKVGKQANFENVKRSQLSKDFPIFKARLRSVYIAGGLLQVITLFYGWMLYIQVHLAVVLVLQFIVGFANSLMFNIFQTLMVDLFPEKSATITASNNLVRCMLGAVATVVIEPGIQGVGAGWIFTIIGLICVASNVLIPVLLKYGPVWRNKRMELLARKIEEEKQTQIR